MPGPSEPCQRYQPPPMPSSTVRDARARGAFLPQRDLTTRAGSERVGAAMAAPTTGGTPVATLRRSSIKSSALAWRPLGSLERSLSVIASRASDIAGFASRGDGAGSLMCFMQTAIGVSASKGTLPVNIS